MGDSPNPKRHKLLKLDSAIDMSEWRRIKLADLPILQKQQALNALNATAQMVRDLSQKAGIDTPTIRFGEMTMQMDSPLSTIAILGKSPQSKAIFVDMRFIEGVEAMVRAPVAPHLRFTRGELLAGIAHEIGHLKSNHTASGIDNEFNADREMVKLGGHPDDLASMLLKTTRFRREGHYEASVRAQAQERPAEAERHLATRTKQAIALRDGNDSHPSLKARIKAAREEYAKTWADRVAEVPDAPERGR